MKKVFTILRVLMLGALMMPVISCEQEKDNDTTHGGRGMEETDITSPTQFKAVDLGLSVEWASCNVGANSPEEYGDYYAWGETKKKNEYTHYTYEFWNDKNGDDQISEGEFRYLGINISETDYDAAHVKLGNGWRMPTEEEFIELKKDCTWEWTSVKGIAGAKVTGTNGNSIFLPAAGSYYRTNNNGKGEQGEYWSSSTISHSNCGELQRETNAIGLYFDFDAEDKDFYLTSSKYKGREFGLPIRAVKE